MNTTTPNPTVTLGAHPAMPTINRDEAEQLGRRMQGIAAHQAEVDHDFLIALGEFDARGAIAHFQGIKSTAHFVAWACSMSGGTAREHVRVARALRTLPKVSELMRQGRLSYSKVRELTRVTDLVAEDELCELALEMTASQVARTVAAYRTACGTRIRALSKRRFTVSPTPDGLVRITVVLPPEEAGIITAAVESAARRGQQAADDEAAERERNCGSAGGQRGDADDAVILPDVPAGTSHRRPPDRVQGLVDVAASYLDLLPGEPDDDHTLVTVHVNAGLLMDAAQAPAAASDLVCHVENHGPIEPATAQRLLCTSPLLGVLVDAAGRVLNLGRAKRLASRAQRRALRVRDRGICQFPGCDQIRHLDAHHLIPWFAGGNTDLDNMVLLCRRHHVLVHEGGIRVAGIDAKHRRFVFTMPDGRPISGTWLAEVRLESMEWMLANSAEQHADRVFPERAGAGFSLQECVRVLFDIQLPEQQPAA